MKSDKKDRRQFLKNTALASLGIGLFSTSAKAKPTDIKPPLGFCDLTTPDFYGQGPFYTEGAPFISDNKLASDSEPGTKLTISGRVFNLDCTEWVPNAEMEVWHANEVGLYDNEGYNLRGKLLSNEQGFYIFETVLPGKYQLRPSHIHFKISAPGEETLTTQLYFEGDDDIPLDPAASLNSGEFDATARIIPLTENADGSLEGTWDIVLTLETVPVRDIHLDKGVIYSLAPNPFNEELTISYGVFQSAKVGLSVYDVQGRLVSVLEDRELPAQKYEAVWRPDAGLPKGHYFIVLRVNDLQIFHQKVSYV